MASSNYAVSYTAADLTITPADRTLTYRATPVTSIYGDTPSLTGTVNATGPRNGDTLTAVTSGAPIRTSAAGATSDIRAYAVAGSGLAPDSHHCLVPFSTAAANAPALDIDRRELTGTADALHRYKCHAQH